MDILQGEKMSRLKQVDDEWILRRLERCEQCVIQHRHHENFVFTRLNQCLLILPFQSWGRKDKMPFISDKKGAIMQRLVSERAPKLAVEVGTMAG